MFRQKLKASLSAKIHRRPNQGAINLLEASAGDINRQLESLLNDANFLYLRSIGMVKRAPYGRVPLSKYQEFKDNALLEFVSRYNLEQKCPEWFSILTSRTVPSHEVADRLGTPLEETIKVATYLRRNNDFPYESSTINSEQFSYPEEQGVQLALEEEVALAQISDFVEMYGLDSKDFHKLFFQTREDQTATSQQYEIPNDRLLTTEKLVNSFLVRDLAYRNSDHENVSVPDTRIIGTISIHPFSGAVILEMAPWCKNAGAYYIQRDPHDALSEELHAPEMKSLLAQVEALQHYSSTLNRIVKTIVKRQEDYLISGISTSLAPLPQSWIAKECSVPRSSVCRIIRNKALDTPHGKIALKQLCCPVGDVIRVLAQSHPDWSARKIAQYLQAVHNVRMTNRNVNYHLTAHFGKEVSS